MTDEEKSDTNPVADANLAAARSDQYAGNRDYWQTGNVITNEAGGSGVPDTRSASPVFDRQRAEALEAAVDEAEDGESGDHLVLPEAETKSNEEAVADLKESAQSAREDVEAKEEEAGKAEGEAAPRKRTSRKRAE